MLRRRLTDLYGGAEGEAEGAGAAWAPSIPHVGCISTGSLEQEAVGSLFSLGGAEAGRKGEGAGVDMLAGPVAPTRVKQAFKQTEDGRGVM